MIQRIQSIYLVIAMLTMAATLFIPFAHYSISDSLYIFDSFGFPLSHEVAFFIPVIFTIILSVLLSFMALFSFKKRKRQMILNKLNFVVILLTIAFIFIDFNFIESTFNLLPENIDYSFGFLFPIASFVAILLANRAINTDEKLIKSMDRIR